MTSNITLIFYGRDGDAAKIAAANVRAKREGAQVRHAEAYRGENEPCASVVLMPCVSEWDAKRIAAVYGDKVAQGFAPPPPPPDASGASDPLDKLPSDWTTSVGTTELKRIAEAVGGRVVDNRDQAIAVIVDELTKRAAQ